MQTNPQTKYRELYASVHRIIQRALEYEQKYDDQIELIHPLYRQSAKNLLHYLAFRSFNIDIMQMDLNNYGLASLNNIEGHVMFSLLNLQNILVLLMGEGHKMPTAGTVSLKKASKILRKNNKQLLGFKSRKRNTRIMVTLPLRAATEPPYVQKLIALGMNCARINCAHDDTDIWTQMIRNIRDAGVRLNNHCTVAMDLAGPKLRTGPMKPGPKVIHLKPKRDDLGNVVQPSKIWLAPPENLPPPSVEYDAILPVDALFASKMKPGSIIYFIDTRGKKGKIIIDHSSEKGCWGHCKDSAYIATGTELILHRMKMTGIESHRVGELLPKAHYLTLHVDDILRLHRENVPGENAIFDDEGNMIAPAHISCTLPEVFEGVRIGDRILFNDGKIGGRVEDVSLEEIIVRITSAKPNGSKLRADKGINLPDSHIPIQGLMPKDIEDLKFVTRYADTINYSFVNTPEDVEQLYDLLEDHGSKSGVIFKIETQKGFANLPAILLRAMRRYPIGVMIARGDLAVETGWKNFATIQNEIRRVCAAAHISDVLATQVLDRLAKKGIPSRSEITDVALADRSECVMLNKGPFIHRAVKLLDRILRRMQRFQNKTSSLLPRLVISDQLTLSHRAFETRDAEPVKQA